MEQQLESAVASESATKRASILNQAIRTFAELGFRGTDVQVIADRASVGKGTVYRYFGNKEDLFWAAVFEVLGRLDRYMHRAMKGIDSPAEKLRAACVGYARFFEANPLCLEVFVQDRAEFHGVVPDTHLEYHEKLIAEFAGIIQQAIAAGEFREVDVRKTVIALGGLLYGTVVFGCYATDEFTPTETAEYSLDAFLDGIRANQG